MALQIDYSKLKEGDVIFTGGTSLIARIIRRVTSKNEQSKTATHCGVVIEVGNQKLIAEMVNDGVSLGSIEKYLTGNKSIVQISRPVFRGDLKTVYIDFIGEAFRKSIGYDFSEVLKFLPFVNGQTSPEKFYCSELVCRALRKAICMVMFDEEGLISPEYLRVQLENLKIDWEKK